MKYENDIENTETKIVLDGRYNESQILKISCRNVLKYVCN